MNQLNKVDAEIAKKFLIASAEKDLEFVNKCQISLNHLIEVGIVSNIEHYCDFKGLLSDVQSQLEDIINNTLDPFTYDGNGEDPVVVEGKFDVKTFSFYTGIYQNCDFDFFPFWEKCIVNTKTCLENLGVDVYWSGERCSGSF